MSLNLLAEYYDSASSNASSGMSSIVLVLYLAVIVVALVGMWKMFVKAGYPGWYSIVPIFNSYILIKMARKPGWWLLLSLIPFVNLWVQLVVGKEIALRFGKGQVYGLLLCGLLGIGYIILGFNSDTYSEVPKNAS
jgi:hypothetical protein